MSLPDNSGFDSFVPISLALGALSISRAVIGIFDKGSTIEVSGPAAIVVSGLIAGPPVLCVVWYWFRPRDDLPRVPAWNLKHDSLGTWTALGLVLLLSVGAGFSYLGYSVSAILAQRVAGAIDTVAATLESVERQSGHYRICDVAGAFKVGWDDRVTFCIKPRAEPFMGAASEAAGNQVYLLVKTNLFGKVVVGIKEAPNHGT